MKIIYTNAITKDVRKIKDQKIIDRVAKTISQIENVSSLDELSSLKKLSGHSAAYRTRIGSYRLGFFYEDDQVVLARFQKRSDIYQVFL